MFNPYYSFSLFLFSFLLPFLLLPTQYQSFLRVCYMDSLLWIRIDQSVIYLLRSFSVGNVMHYHVTNNVLQFLCETDSKCLTIVFPMSYKNSRKRKSLHDSEADSSCSGSRHSSTSRFSSSLPFTTFEHEEIVSASLNRGPSRSVYNDAPSIAMHRDSIDDEEEEEEVHFPYSLATATPRNNPRVHKFRKLVNPYTKIIVDTPAKARTSESSETRSKYVKKQQKVVFQELGRHIPRGSLDYFLSIMPPLRSEFDIEWITEYLIQSGDLVKWGDTLVWNELKEISVARENVNYNKTLVNIFRAVLDAAEKTSLVEPSPVPILSLITGGNSVPWSARGSNLKPDGYLVLRETRESKLEKVLWYNIAACLEFKKDSGSIQRFEACCCFLVSFCQMHL